MGHGRDQQVLENLAGILEMGRLLLFYFGGSLPFKRDITVWIYDKIFTLWKVNENIFFLSL